jgi:NADH dehydrogenase
MPKRIFVTGASGFVGAAVVEELVRRGFGVNALVNRRDLSGIAGDIRSVKGDLFDPVTLDSGMTGCDAVLHLVGIIMEQSQKGITFARIHAEGTKAAVESTRRAGIRRFIQMSALGTRENAVSTYHKTKWQGELAVRNSELDWTIIRPSMIHGPRGEFMQVEAKWARKQAPPYLFMPYFGKGFFGLGGAGGIQPVYVNEVARAFVDAIENPTTVKQTYELGGSDQLTWPRMHNIVARKLVGKNRLTMAIPAWYAKLLTKIAPAAWLPFNWDQVVMSQEENTCDLIPFERDFGWKPLGFEAAFGAYAAAL